MVNLRSKSKAKAVAPRAALKMESTISTPPTASDNLNLSEVTLRKLSRVELQKLAMVGVACSRIMKRMLRMPRSTK